VIALQEKPLSSVNRRPTLAAVPAAEPVFTAYTATTASETFTVWRYPQDNAFSCTFADPRNGTILNNNPVNFIDPTGEAAIEAHDYWTGVAVSGQDAGGVLGNLQTAGASVMMSFIDFWGTRTLEKNAGLSGQYSANDECQGKAWLYGGLSVGQIGLEAFGAAKAMDAAKYSLKLAPHGAHHYFKLFGDKLPHLQLNAWIEGVKGSGKVVFRIPWPF
jgi:hypothetical protein